MDDDEFYPFHKINESFDRTMNKIMKYDPTIKPIGLFDIVYTFLGILTAIVITLYILDPIFGFDDNVFLIFGILLPLYLTYIISKKKRKRNFGFYHDLRKLLYKIEIYNIDSESAADFFLGIEKLIKKRIDLLVQMPI